VSNPKKAKKPADPKGVFLTAETFRAGSLVLGKYGMPHLMLPMVVCAAFSLELLLKCLILIEGHDFGKDHSLESLFSKTTPESQKTIRASYEVHRAKREAMYAALKNVPAPKTDFDFVLHASAKAFEHFRYAYEGIVEEGEGWLANEIHDCVRERIVELKPDWKNLNSPSVAPGK